MSGGEAGVNPFEGMAAGERAEALAGAMAGLSDMFDHLVGEAISAAENWNVQNGYRTFLNRHLDHIIDVQEHGMQLAENIQSGVSSIAENDVKNAEEYTAPWQSLRDINF